MTDAQNPFKGLHCVCPPGIRPTRLALGLTGNPGAGKTTVAGILERQGARVISGDALGHDLLNKESPVFDQIVRTFGNSILDVGGEIRREKLGNVVFRSTDELERLNRLVHPILVERIRAGVMSFRHSNDVGPLVVDAALIFEWGIADMFDAILVVTAPIGQRRERFSKMKGVSSAEFDRREKTQLSEFEKMRRGNILISNQDDPSALQANVEKIIKG